MTTETNYAEAAEDIGEQAKGMRDEIEWIRAHFGQESADRQQRTAEKYELAHRVLSALASGAVLCKFRNPELGYLPWIDEYDVVVEPALPGDKL